MIRLQAVAVLIPLSLGLGQTPPADTVGQRWEYDSFLGRYTVEVVATGFQVPFGLSFLPDGQAIVSDRGSGRLLLVDVGSGRVTPIQGAPVTVDSVTHAAGAIGGAGDGGLLDVVVHPDYASNGWIYYAFTEASDTGTTTVVERAQLRRGRLTQKQRLFAAYPTIRTLHHLGARLVVTGGYLFITLGDRDVRQLAQEMWTDHGKIIRLHDDSRVPTDNPFVGVRGARSGIWSVGHRNPHGLAVHPLSGELWETEHGPLGGDELNVVRRGANYGWPRVTHGREYAGHPVDGATTEAPGIEQPAYFYASSAGISGLAFYTGDAFPQWRGNAFVGAMTPRYLGRITIAPGRPIREERLLTEKRWRVRVIQQGPDGSIYLGIDRSGSGAMDGKIVRLRPA